MWVTRDSIPRALVREDDVFFLTNRAIRDSRADATQQSLRFTGHAPQIEFRRHTPSRVLKQRAMWRTGSLRRGGMSLLAFYSRFYIVFFSRVLVNIGPLEDLRARLRKTASSAPWCRTAAGQLRLAEVRR